MTGKCSRLRGNRPKAMWGSIVGGLINLGASYLSSRSQAKAMKQQLDAQKELAKEQMLATNQNSLANTLNDYATAQQSYDNQDYNLKYRNGGRKSILRGNNVVITDGGVAQPINDNTFLLRGGSHEDVNETGQTGIGINVGGNQIEAEGGEVAQEKNGALRIFSAQPILGNGMSPAQAILRGYNKDKVFAAQERFKRNNHLNDDGSKARKGGLFRKLYTATTGKHLGESNYYKGSDGKYHPKRTELKVNSDGSYRTGDFINNKNNTRVVSQLPLQQVSPEFDIISGIRGLGFAKPQKPAMNLNIRGKAISNSAKYRRFIANRYTKGKNYSNDVLDRTYETAYKKSQNDVVKDLRDTHFVRTANAPYTKNNKPVKLYHTTNAENPNFTTFDTNIEGRPTAIYTTDSDVMSMSYNHKKAFNSRIEPAKRFLKDAFDRRKGFYNDADKIEKFLNDTYYEGMDIYDMPYIVQVAIKGNKDGKSYKDIIQNVIDDYRYAGDKSVNSLISRPNYAPQYMKTLYSNSSSLKNPYITIEGEGHNWNAVNSALENKLLYPKLYSDDITGNISTRDIERSLMDTRDADRVIINSITDYGADLYGNTPHTVIENLNPSDLKYSNPVTYDDKGNFIPLSQRDNFRNPDMRYRNGGKISKLRLRDRARYATGGKVTKAKHTTIRLDGTVDYNSGFTPNNGQAGTMGLTDPLFQVLTLGKSTKLNQLIQATKAYNKIRNNKINISKEYRDKSDVYKEYGKFVFGLVNPLFRNGGKIKYNKPDYYHWMNQTSNNLKVSPIDSTYDYRAYYDSATPWELANTMYNAKNGHFTDVGKRPSHPTFSSESKYSNSKTPGGTWNCDVFVPAIWQFGNDGNGYRNWYMNNTGEGYFDGKHNVYPRSKKAKGGWVKPVYPTVGYHGSKRVRQYIAKAEGSDFAKQNKQFKGDAIGAKELELRNFMGKAYQHLNEGQRDALLSYYYNLTPKTFVNQYKGLRDRLINAQTEQEYNDTINAMKNSINVGWNNAKLPGLRNRRAVERSWFGYVNPTAQQMVDDKIDQIETAPVDNTMVQRPIIVETPQQEVHVPAGVVPVQNTEPNLFNGDIKQNIIDMGNQFKVKYSCGGTARKKGRLGLASRPLKGMYRCGGTARPKKLLGDNVWQANQAERDNQDKGGITPWTTSNKFAVQYPYAITDKTPTIPYYTQVASTPVQINKVDTVKNNNLDFSNNNSRLLFGTGDYVSLGADLFSALGSSIINGSAYNGLNFDYDLPGYVDESPVALNTTYHNEAQVANVERNRLNARNSILRNSMSSGSALSRVQSADTNAMYQQNQLFDEKSNKETELRNQNLLNEQQVRARNAAAKNQWLQSVAGIKNSAIAAKNQAQLAKANSLSVGLSGVGQAVNNFISQGRQNYDDEQAMLMGIAASDYATPSRLIDLGVNLSPSTLAGIYRSIANTPNPGDAPKPEDYTSTTEYSIAKNAYDRNIKAYNNRNAYANLIKGKMSLKNRNRYGII